MLFQTAATAGSIALRFIDVVYLMRTHFENVLFLRFFILVSSSNGLANCNSMLRELYWKVAIFVNSLFVIYS